MSAYTPSPEVWNPTPSVIEAGNSSRSQYNPYRRIQANEETQLRVWPSVKRFRDVVMTLFPGFSSGGIKRSPRREPIVGRIRDPHEEGRAIDFMTRNPEVGDPLANWLVLHAQDLGVQLVMWRGTEWSSSDRLPKFERIEGNPHNDHVHMEFNDTVKEMSPEEIEIRIRRAFSSNQQPSNQSVNNTQQLTEDTRNNTINTTITNRTLELPNTPINTPTIEQSEDVPSANLAQENERVTMLSPEELSQKAFYLQTLEKNKIYIAIGIATIILGGIGYVIYKRKLKQKSTNSINKVSNGKNKKKIKYKIKYNY